MYAIEVLETMNAIAAARIERLFCLDRVSTGSGSDLVVIGMRYFAKDLDADGGPGRYRSLY